MHALVPENYAVAKTFLCINSFTILCTSVDATFLHNLFLCTKESLWRKDKMFLINMYVTSRLHKHKYL